MDRIHINMKSVEEITDFCKIVSHYEQVPMEVRKQESRFNPKSIIGMMTVVYDHDVELVIHGTDETAKSIREKITPYIYEGEA